MAAGGSGRGDDGKGKKGKGIEAHNDGANTSAERPGGSAAGRRAATNAALQNVDSGSVQCKISCCGEFLCQFNNYTARLSELCLIFLPILYVYHSDGIKLRPCCCCLSDYLELQRSSK